MAFEDEEQILCFHGPLVYEAKILKGEIWDGRQTAGEGPHYFVHYKGWKQTWDEWVPETRILKWSDANLARQKQLQETHAVSRKKVGGIKEREKHDSGTDRGKKRSRDQSADKEEEFTKRPEIKIPIPEALKVRLVDDWERITKSQLLVPLPRKPTVVAILEMYRQSKNDKKSSTAPAGTGIGKEIKSDETLNEVVDGLRLYFDTALGNILLYRFERQQYIDIRKAHKGKAMSDIYGAEHLLRLFVQLPMLISHTNMDQDAVKNLQTVFVDFLKFMQKNSRIFVDKYEAASPAYLSMSKSN